MRISDWSSDVCSSDLSRLNLLNCTGSTPQSPLHQLAAYHLKRYATPGVTQVTPPIPTCYKHALMQLWNSYATGTALLTICGTALTAQTRSAGRHRPEGSVYLLSRDKRSPTEGFSVASSDDPMRDPLYRLERAYLVP